MGLLRTIYTSGEPDEELIRKFREKADLEVLGHLYSRYMELVYGVCLKYLRQPEDAQDSTMVIFGELSAKLLKHEVGNFKSWLYTLAKNHCLMKLRSAKKALHIDFDLTLVQSEDSVHLNGMLEKEENFRRMEICLSRLPDEQRQAIEMFYLQGRCYNEISAVTGIEWNKVRSHIQNGRRNLKICIEKNAKAVNESAVKP